MSFHIILKKRSGRLGELKPSKGLLLGYCLNLISIK